MATTDVCRIPTEIIAAFGGMDGIRDEGLLESAVAAPQATACGGSPFSDIVQIAAAYLFYLSRNHPYHDGNKLVGMVASIVFLRLNGLTPAPDSEAWEALMLDVATSRLDRLQTTERLRAMFLR